MKVVTDIRIVPSETEDTCVLAIRCGTRTERYCLSAQMLRWLASEVIEAVGQHGAQSG